MANRVTMTICGTEYILVAEEDAAYMEKIGSMVDTEMRSLMDSAHMSRDAAAVLAALLLGFQLVEEHSLTEGMAEFLPIYKVLGKIPLVRNISNRIVVLQK